MKKPLKLFLYLTIFALFLSCSVNVCAASVKIDGIKENVEWLDSIPWAVSSEYPQTNCALEYIYCSIIVESDEQSVFLAVQALGEAIEPGNTLLGASVCADGKDFAFCSADGTLDFNADKYALEAVFQIDDTGGFTAEIRLGLKKDFSALRDIYLRVYDAYGIPSTVFVKTVVEPEEETTKERTTSAKEERETKKEKTTAAKATLSTTEEPEETKATTTKKPNTSRKVSDSKRETTALSETSSEYFSSALEAEPTASAAVSVFASASDSVSAAGLSVSLKRNIGIACAAALILAALVLITVSNVRGEKKS